MPKDDNQAQSPQNTTVPVVGDMPPIMMEDTQPPMINEGEQATVISDQSSPVTNHQSPIADSGSAAPTNDIVMPSVVTSGPNSANPAKKFGGGKIIATILGLFLLVGGVGAGVMLTQQNQDIREKAYKPGCDNSCDDNYECVCPEGVFDWWGDSNKCGEGDDQWYCEFKPDNQEYCDHTICPVGYKCNRDGDTTFCEPQSSATDKPGPNKPPAQECPTGTTLVCGSGSKEMCVKYVGDCESKFPSKFTLHEADDPNGCCQGECSNGHNSYCQYDCTCQAAPTTPPTTGRAVCLNLAIYSKDYSKKYIPDNSNLGADDPRNPPLKLSTLKTGDEINICVAGVATQGGFDKARFTINGTQGSAVTRKRPDSADFCTPYKIPTEVTTFTMSAQVHHGTLGWK